MKMIAVVLGADNFDHRTLLHALVTLDCVPRRREGARILDMDVDLQRLAVVDHAEAFDHVQRVGVRGLVVVDIGVGGDPDGIDDESVSPS